MMCLDCAGVDTAAELEIDEMNNFPALLSTEDLFNMFGPLEERVDVL